jgi:hypothetical protein
MLQGLLDKQAITERIYDYGRSMDRIDPALGKACFHEDALVDYGAERYQGTAAGFVDMCMAAHPHFSSHAHQFSNVRIWMLGNDRARSETYCDVTLRRVDESGQSQDMRTLGRYIDEWTKRDGNWRIFTRIYLHDLDQSGPGAGLFGTTGRRDRADPSYFGR